MRSRADCRTVTRSSVTAAQKAEFYLDRAILRSMRGEEPD